MASRSPMAANTKKARMYDCIRAKRDAQSEDYNARHDGYIVNPTGYHVYRPYQWKIDMALRLLER